MSKLDRLNRALTIGSKHWINKYLLQKQDVARVYTNDEKYIRGKAFVYKYYNGTGKLPPKAAYERVLGTYNKTSEEAKGFKDAIIDMYNKYQNKQPMINKEVESIYRFCDQQNLFPPEDMKKLNKSITIGKRSNEAPSFGATLEHYIKYVAVGGLALAADFVNYVLYNAGFPGWIVNAGGAISSYILTESFNKAQKKKELAYYKGDTKQLPPDINPHGIQQRVRIHEAVALRDGRYNYIPNAQLLGPVDLVDNAIGTFYSPEDIYKQSNNFDSGRDKDVDDEKTINADYPTFDPNAPIKQPVINVGPPLAAGGGGGGGGFGFRSFYNNGRNYYYRRRRYTYYNRRSRRYYRKNNTKYFRKYRKYRRFYRRKNFY